MNNSKDLFYNNFESYQQKYQFAASVFNIYMQLDLARDPDAYTRSSLASNPNLIQEAQYILLENSDLSIKRNLATNPALYSFPQQLLSQEDDHVIDVNLTQNPFLAPFLQKRLAQKSSYLRQLLLLNIGLDAFVLQELMDLYPDVVDYLFRLSVLPKYRHSTTTNLVNQYRQQDFNWLKHKTKQLTLLRECIHLKVNIFEGVKQLLDNYLIYRWLKNCSRRRQLKLMRK